MIKHITSYLTILIIVVNFFKPITTENLENQNNNNYLDPINENFDNEYLKEQSKRTLFSNSLPNYGWAKHVAVHPSGFKYVLGYGAVDLKYIPVAKPLAFKPIYRPKWNKPTIIQPPIHHHHPQNNGWKPLVPIVKPPINVPPVYGLPNKSPIWQQNGWNKPIPIKPSKPLIPIHEPSFVIEKPVNTVSIVPSKPLIPVNRPVPILPVTPVRLPVAVPVFPSNPFHPIATPIHPIAAPIRPVAKPVHPIVAPAPPIVTPVHQIPSHIHPVATPVHPVSPPLPIVPSPLFEVTKPNLNVLPFGAIFPSPVLQNPPIRQLPLPLPYPHPVAGSTIEFHGTNKFIPVIPQLIPAHAHPAPALVPQIPHHHQVPVVQQIPPHHHHEVPVVQQIPHHHHEVPHEQHDVQTPLIPQNHPLFLNDHHHHHQQQFNLIEQQQHLIGHENHGNEHQIVIQPGQTDLQFPLHLPQHPNYLPPNTNDGRQFQTEFFHQSNNLNEQNIRGNVIRPSISLEPPFS